MHKFSLLSALLQLVKGSTSTAVQPPTVQNSSTADFTHLFYLLTISGNISRCQGCTGKILRGSPPPDDLIVQHKEQVLFQNPNTGYFQLSHDFRNVYYHARLSCIRQKFPAFVPSKHLQVHTDVAQKLTSVHKNYLCKEFCITQ